MDETQPPSCWGVTQKIGIFQRSDAEWENKTFVADPERDFDWTHCTRAEDVKRRLTQCVGIVIGKRAFQSSKASMCVFETGLHILGSSIVEISLQKGGTRKNWFFQAILATVTRRYFRTLKSLERSGRAIAWINPLRWSQHRPMDETLVRGLKDNHSRRPKNGGNITNSFLCGWANPRKLSFVLGQVVSKRASWNNKPFFLDSPMAIADGNLSSISGMFIYGKMPPRWAKQKKSSLHTFYLYYAISNLHGQESMHWIELSFQAPNYYCWLAVLCVRVGVFVITLNLSYGT